MTAGLEPAEAVHVAERARRGGRAGKRASAGDFEQPPFRQLRNSADADQAVSDDELESIHLASLRVLKEIGVDVLHDEARAHHEGAWRGCRARAASACASTPT